MTIRLYPPPPDIEPILQTQNDLDGAFGISVMFVAVVCFAAGLVVGLTVNVARFWMFGQ